MDGDLVKTTGELIQRVKRLLARQKLSASTQRILIALAGVPGSGKTTISDALIQELKRNDMSNIAVLPMDGFHYTRTTLSSFPDPEEAFRRRGAPFTFNAAAFVDLVALLKKTPITTDDEPEIIIKAPGFDHARKDPIPNAIEISSRAKIVIIEGNYVLLDQEPWSRIPALMDDKWFVDIPVDIARERLASRHLRAGIETTIEAATQRTDENDIPNGEYIRSHLIEPNIRIVN